MKETTRVAIIGGGMITHDQILPSVLHLQRSGVVGEITVCASRRTTVESLAAAPIWKEAFPDQAFQILPGAASAETPQPDLFRSVIANLPPGSIVVIALPDQMHHDAIMTALRHEQHVIAVKPLVLGHQQAHEIEHEARQRGLFVGVEYHKRFDDRSLMARRRYRSGQFGEFVLGTASLMEKWYYRNSNFQSWCTVENSDAFTYIGCHYIDLVHFITGLLPRRVSVYGIRDTYPNGKEGFLWTDARVIWDNGACLNVQNTLSFPDEAPGPNTQGMTLYCRGNGNGSLLRHSDQYRGLEYCYTSRPGSPGSTQYSEPSPDYFQYVEWDGPGLKPVGYGYRSIEHLVKKCVELESADIRARQSLLAEADRAGLLATPANSRYNELVIEAGRLSILNDGREATIDYGPEPGVRLV